MAKRIRFAFAALVLFLGAGCGEGSLFSASVWDPLGLVGRLSLSGEPVRIGVTAEPRKIFDVRQWGKEAPWDPLARELSKHLGRPVIVENMQPFQIRFHLVDTGRLQFALMPFEDHAPIVEEGPVGRVLAVSEPWVRQGVIVANAKSDIKSIADLKGKPFAFGPKGDPILHEATAALLTEAGLPPSKLLTLIPGMLEHHISSDEAAKEVAYGLVTRAGVIEAGEFDAYPETGGKWSPFAWTFSKDQFRELGRTAEVRVETMGEGPLIAGPQTDEELAAAVQEFLLSADQEHPKVVHALGFSRFRAAPVEAEEELEHAASNTAE